MGHGSRCACGELRQHTCTFRVISKPVREDKPAAVQKHHTLALININAACTQTSSLCVQCCPGTWTQIFCISFALILMTGRRGPNDASRRHTETSCSQMHDTVDWVLAGARTAQPPSRVRAPRSVSSDLTCAASTEHLHSRTTGLALEMGMVHVSCTASRQTRGTFWELCGPPSRRHS